MLETPWGQFHKALFRLVNQEKCLRGESFPCGTNNSLPVMGDRRNVDTGVRGAPHTEDWLSMTAVLTNLPEPSWSGPRLLKLLSDADLAVRHGRGGLEDNRIRALRAIAEGGRRGLSQSALIRTLGLSGPAVSKLVDNLEVRRLIERDFHTQDRRQRQLRLSAEGLRQLNTCGDALDRCATSVFGDLSAEDLAYLEKLLRQLVDRTPPRHCAGVCENCAVGGC